MSFGNVNKMMKQVQKMQKDMARLETELAERTVEATAGGGMVRVVCTGKQEIKAVILEREVVDPDDVEMLQDLIVAAINESLRSSLELAREEMNKITGGLSLPSMPWM